MKFVHPIFTGATEDTYPAAGAFSATAMYLTTMV
jgi:hypothetical protein